MSTSDGNGKDQELPAGQPAPDTALPEADSSAGPETPESVSEEHSLQELPPTREQLAELRRERDDLNDRLLRRRAEFENFRKRSEREQEAAAADAVAAVLRRLLDTVDNLERALHAEGEEDALRRGVELTLQELLSVFDVLGIVVLDPRGERFDPKYHQALLYEPVPGLEHGVVAEVFRKGYTYKDRLLRPALVKVASDDVGDEVPVDGGGAGEVQ